MLTAIRQLKRSLRALLVVVLLPIWIGIALLIWTNRHDAQLLAERDIRLTVQVLVTAVDRALIDAVGADAVIGEESDDGQVVLADRLTKKPRIDMSSSLMTSVMSQHVMPADWVGAIFDDNGILFARTFNAEKFVGHQVSPSLYDASRNAFAGTFRGITLDGVDSTTVFVKSPISGWGVAIGIPTVDFNLPLWKTLSVSAGMMIGLGIVSLIAVRFVTRTVAKAFALAQERHDAALAAETKERERAAMFADLSHEMNTPLLIISGATDLMADGGFNAAHCDRIQAQVMRINAQLAKITLVANVA